MARLKRNVKRTAPDGSECSRAAWPSDGRIPSISPAFSAMSPYQPDGPNLAHNPKVAGSNPAPAIEKPANRRLFVALAWRGNGRVTHFSVTRPFIGVAPQRESGCKQLPSLERLSADLRVLAPDVVLILGARLANCEPAALDVQVATGAGPLRAPSYGRCKTLVGSDWMSLRLGTG